jgi:hypothetical protein
MESRRGYRDYRKTTQQPAEKNKRRDSGYFFSPPHETEQPPPEAFTIDATLAAAHPLTYEELFNPYVVHGDPNTAALQQSYQVPAPPTNIMPSPISSSTSSSVTTVQIPREAPLARNESLTPPGNGKEPSDLVDVFYKYFNRAHPFLIPSRLYKQQPELLPEPLRAAIRYLAAHYVPNNNIAALQKAASIVFSDQVPDDVYKIQALMLYTCACFARYENMAGAAALDLAIRTALKIGLNRQSFAITHAPDNPVIQESCRRTYWTLFLFEGMITAIGGQITPFRLHTTYADVLLPGEDAAYASLRSSPVPRSLLDFRNRAFAEDQYSYSSFAYAIEAMYMMGSVFELGPDTFAITDHQVEALDASISNFFLSLPPSKREVVPSPDGSLDETLLFAHMVANWAAILVHRPRSTLTFIRNHYSTICTRVEQAGLPALAYASHTSKTLRAANSLISLASIQRPMTYCSPCMVCAITTAATVHLPAYAIADSSAHAGAIKERLQVGITALGRFSELWPRAGIAKSQVAGFAREVLTRPSVCVDSTGPDLPQATPIAELGQGNGVLVEAVPDLPNLPALEFAGHTVHASEPMKMPAMDAGQGQMSETDMRNWMLASMLGPQNA